MKNLVYLDYTYLHRKALKFMIERCIKDDDLRAKLLERAKWHDLDKSLLYTLVSKKQASGYHRAHASHHMENNGVKAHEDIVEAIMDYECAAITKPDKPLNAYDTILKFKVNNEEQLMKALHEMGMDTSYQVQPDDEWEKFIAPFLPVTEEAIMEEIYEYCINKPDEAKEVLKWAKENMEENV